MENQNKKKMLILAVVLLAVLVVAGAAYHLLGDKFKGDQLATQSTPAPNAGTEEGAAPEETPLPIVPDFTVYSADGEAVNLHDFLGKPIVLNFWASWCGPCKSEMPAFDKLSAELDGEVQFLMINMTDGKRETVATASQFIEDNGYTNLDVYFDTQQDAAMTYGAYALPTSYFIDANGVGIAQAQGAIDEETLRRGIAMITEQEAA